MMRLPWFEYRAPANVAEAARMLAAEGPEAMLLAGGTDLLPNMKRRQQTPRVLVSLRNCSEMRRIANGSGHRLGGAITLSEIVDSDELKSAHRGLWQAAAQVATVHLRNMGTIGGNLCLDTRCNYYDQNYEWRKAIDFCLKRDGTTCWVATASKRCVAASSTDCAPALIALGARVRLVSATGEREIALESLYLNDGIEYLARRPDEILTEVILPASGMRSTYWKLRRRGAFDFPVLGVAAAVSTDAGGTITAGRIVLGAVASRPVVVERASTMLIGRKLSDATIAEVSAAVASRAKPLDNTDLDLYWRKDVVGAFVGYALKELRGDAMSEVRMRIARQAF